MVFGGFSGGNALGIAQGRIVINTSSLIQAQMVVAQVSRNMSQNLTGVGNAGDQAANRIGASFATITVAGVAAAYRVQRIEGLFRHLSGSQEEANRNMEELRQLADQAQMPFLELLGAANSLLPVTRRNNASLRETMSIAQRLAILDPFQGIAGAGIALREFLSGTYTSLAMRFELERPRLKRILSEAGGDINAALAGLDAYINEIGLTEEALIEMGQQGIFAFEALRDEAIMTLSAAFTPFLNDVVLPIVSGIRAIFMSLRELNPEVLRFSGAMATALTAAYALQRVTGGSGGRFGGATRGVMQAGLLYMLADQSANATLGMLRAFDRRGQIEIDPRLRAGSGEEAGDVIGERIKQLVVLLFEGLNQLNGVLMRGAMWVGNAFDQIVIGIRRAGLGIEDAFLSIKEAVGRAIRDFGVSLGNTDMANTGQQMVTEVQQRRIGELQVTQWWDPIEGVFKEIYQNVNGIYDQMRSLEAQGATGFSWTAEMEAIVQAALQNARESVIGPITEALFPEIFVEEVIEPMARGSDRLGGLLDEFGDGLTEAGVKLHELMEDFNIQNAREQYSRQIQGQREDEDYWRNRARSIEDFNRQELRTEEANLEARQDILDRIAELGSEGDEERIEALNENLKDQRRALEDHRRNVLEIQRDMAMAVEDAIAERNSSAAQSAIRSGEERLTKENEQYRVASQRREEDFQATLADMNKRREAQIADAQRQLSDLIDQQNRQRAQRQADFSLQMQIEDQERAIRLRRLQEDYALEDYYRWQDLIRKQNAILYEQGLNEQALGQFQALLGGARQSLIQFAVAMAQEANMLAGVPPTPQPIRTYTYTPPQYYQYQNRQQGGPTAAWRRTRVGEQGPEWAIFSEPATVYPAGTTPPGGGSSGNNFFDMSGWQIFTQATDGEELMDELEEKFIGRLEERLRRAKSERGSLAFG